MNTAKSAAMVTFSEVIQQRAAACPTSFQRPFTSNHLDAASPILIDGLLSSLPPLEALLDRDAAASVVLDESPWRWVPTFRGNLTVVRPAQRVCTLQTAVGRIRSPSRRHQAYIRHHSLEDLPAFASALNASARVSSLVGGHVQRANLWLGDGGLASALHYDSFDNLLLQIAGEKLVLLLPPRAGRILGYEQRIEHMHVFDGKKFMGTRPTGAAQPDNLSPLSLTSAEEHSLPEGLFTPDVEEEERRLASASSSVPIPPRALDGAFMCRVVPGRALLIPALWSHAVISSRTPSEPSTASQATPSNPARQETTPPMANQATDTDTERASCDPTGGIDAAPRALNAALNVWYVRGDESIQRALTSGAAEWPAARAALVSVWSILARRAAAAGSYEEAAAIFGRLSALDLTDAGSHHLHGVALQDAGLMANARSAFATAARLRPEWAAPKAALSALKERARLAKAIASAKGGWSRELERTLRQPRQQPADAVRQQSAEAVRHQQADDVHQPADDVHPPGGREIPRAGGIDAAILQYDRDHPDATALCIDYLGGDRRAAEKMHTSDTLVRCHAEFRLATGQTGSSVGQQLDRFGPTLPVPRRWDAARCRSDHMPGVQETCAFAARAWGVGRTKRGGWDADLEPAAVVSSPDAVARAQVINDARELRFVRFDNPLLARGVASAQHTPGMAETPWHVYAAQQGLAQAIEYLGLPHLKMAWDLTLYSMAIEELRPQSIIELGTAAGAHAMWLGDEARKRGLRTSVHTFDIKSAHEIATAYGIEADTWQELMRQRGVTFHGEADLNHAQVVLPDTLLRSLPHPWIVIEDAHANTAAVVKRLFRYMEPGDYLVIEDIRFADRKRHEWFAFLRECADTCAIDLKYTDFFGVNQCCAPDGWVKKL